MILTKAQAEVVQRAMQMLQTANIEWAHLKHDGFPIVQTSSGAILVAHKFGAVGDERYADQAAFATAYGLNSDEWQSDVAAAAGGLTQTAIER